MAGHSQNQQQPIPRPHPNCEFGPYAGRVIAVFQAVLEGHVDHANDKLSNLDKKMTGIHERMDKRESRTITVLWGAIGCLITVVITLVVVLVKAMSHG